MPDNQLILRNAAGQWRVRLDRPACIAIEQTFGPDQPVHFGAERAEREAWRVAGFVGDTRRGGSCNVDILRIVPHCNGTHTETAGHIVSEPVPVSRRLTEGLIVSRLVSVAPVPARECGECYEPPLEPGDRVVTGAAIRRALAASGGPESPGAAAALIVRTLPNGRDKTTRDWSAGDPPAFFTGPAIEAVLDSGFSHLLVDLPSVDRARDEGRMHNHCLFWSVDPDTRQPRDRSVFARTITELIYVPDAVPDGDWMLAVQVPPFATDAAPSRPVLYPLEPGR